MWNKEQQGMVLGSIFWGYMLTNIAGGIAATRYGGKRVIGGALAAAAVLTAATPAAARRGVYAMVGVRVLVGACLVSMVQILVCNIIWKKVDERKHQGCKWIKCIGYAAVTRAKTFPKPLKLGTSLRLFLPCDCTTKTPVVWENPILQSWV